ncbi:hypothetical protein MKW94_004330 [Papaver nudicaule]|uniref:Nucleoplasmin-like domain-containing protein n=1 Tax=Papaver nudicaule TaxID=74823 RepID=A0AA41VWZ4_PAPNU|nr:hypothetical protein [Papaver nudicaule]
MGFFGIIVPPGNPVTVRVSKAQGKLKITKASLGSHVSNDGVIVTCSVSWGEASVVLCLNETNRTCSLDLEFDEEDGEFAFTFNSRHVYLTGYYTGRCQCHSTNNNCGKTICFAIAPFLDTVHGNSV